VSLFVIYNRFLELDFGRLSLVFFDRLVVEILSGGVCNWNVLGGGICRRGVLNWSFGRCVLSGSDVFDRGRSLVVLIFRIVQ
jgi:hypothetical protein